VVSSITNYKGTKWETRVVNYLRAEGFEADRLRTSGRDDEGDIRLVINGRTYIIEAKDDRSNRLGPWADRVLHKAANYARHRGELYVPYNFVLHKRLGSTKVGEALVVMNFHEYLSEQAWRP